MGEGVKPMDGSDLKKVLAGVAIGSLLAGTALWVGGCAGGKSG